MGRLPRMLLQAHRSDISHDEIIFFATASNLDDSDG